MTQKGCLKSHRKKCREESFMKENGKRVSFR